MNAHTKQQLSCAPSRNRKLNAKSAASMLLALTAASLLGACTEHLTEPQVAGWLLADARERHPIMLSKQPSTMTVHVPHRSYGLTPAQRARSIAFFRRYKAEDAGNTRLIIHAPTGGSNEISVQHAIGELRHIASELGFSGTEIDVRTFRSGRGKAPAIRVTYQRYVAEGPDCGYWPKNLAETSKNLTYADFGCADQKNFAAMVANPADLEGPRTMTPRPSARRDQVWDKFKKGESTVADKKQDEKVRVKVKE